MRKEKMVTRTVSIINVEVLVVDIVSRETLTTNVTYPSATYLETEALKRANAIMPDNHKAVAVINYTRSELLYGMPESKFIELAQVLPPRKGGEE